MKKQTVTYEEIDIETWVTYQVIAGGKHIGLSRNSGSKVFHIVTWAEEYPSSFCNSANIDASTIGKVSNRRLCKLCRQALDNAILMPEPYYYDTAFYQQANLYPRS